MELDLLVVKNGVSVENDFERSEIKYTYKIL